MYSIQKACHEDWSQMTPGEQGRHCAACDKQVIDFTRLSEAESRKILSAAAAKSGSAQTGICGRMHTDSHGAAQFAGKRRVRLLTDALAAMLAVSLLGSCQEAETMSGSTPQLVTTELSAVVPDSSTHSVAAEANSPVVAEPAVEQQEGPASDNNPKRRRVECRSTIMGEIVDESVIEEVDTSELPKGNA